MKNYSWFLFVSLTSPWQISDNFINILSLICFAPRDILCFIFDVILLWEINSRKTNQLLNMYIYILVENSWVLWTKIDHFESMIIIFFLQKWLKIIIYLFIFWFYLAFFFFQNLDTAWYIVLNLYRLSVVL
jgi:hypothetical protein